MILFICNHYFIGFKKEVQQIGSEIKSQRQIEILLLQKYKQLCKKESFVNEIHR